MAKKKNEISLNFKVERSNQLNQLSPSGMSLTEIRFLAIYQAKINARNPESRVVTFPLDEFCNIMEVKELNVAHIKNVADKIICKPVHIPDGKNGVYVVPLFNKCHIRIDEKIGKWLVDIKCSEEVLPYMFEMKKNYFTYELWNALKLKSVNQVRMYEVLKQYEKIGVRTIEIDELKRMLGIGKNQYSRFQDFRRKVLELCQEALERYTDIKYTFEPIKQGRKFHALKFNITKNPKFKDDLKLKEFINPSDLSDILEPQKSVEVVESMEKVVEKSIPQSEPQQYPDLVTKVYNKCHKVYTMEQVQSLLDMAEMISNNPGAYIVNMYHTIRAYNTKINNMYNYTLSVIQADLKKSPPKESPKKKKKRETSYDINEFMDFVHSTKRNMVGDDYQEEVKSTPKVEEVSNYPEETQLEIPSNDIEEIYDDFEEILASGELPF